LEVFGFRITYITYFSKNVYTHIEAQNSQNTLSVLILADFIKIRQNKFPAKIKTMTIRQIKSPPKLTKNNNILEKQLFIIYCVIEAFDIIVNDED